jgi:ankyrin repeat protein
MVQLIIDSCPESIDKATNNGRTPLHFLCCNENLDASIKLDILGLVVEVCSEAAQHADDDGYTLLHVICNNKNTTLGMVQLLIDAYPESIDRANNAGGTPLRFLCANNEIEDNTAVGILGLLLERCPEAARRAETSGALPIHVACGVGFKSPEFCRMLIEAYPGSERIAAMGVLPLHIACTLGSVAVAEYLLKLYPESINVADSDGAYPIHKAIIRVNSETPTIASEMVQMLLNCDPNVASQKPRGRGEFTPLYLVCSISTLFRGDDGVATSRVNAAFKIAQLLYDAYPEAIENNNLSSIINMFPEEIQAFINTQLTYACQARNTRQMNTPDVNGQLPLHRVLRDNVTLGSIKLLLKRNPSVILTPDNSGALPLHVAIQHHDSPKVVDYLIGLDPNTLTAVDREGNTALHLACRGAKYDTIALLLEKYDAVSVSQGNVLNKLPIHLLLESDATASREDDIKYMESVFQLLRAYPETVMVSGDQKQQSIPQRGRPSRNGKKRKYRA